MSSFHLVRSIIVLVAGRGNGKTVGTADEIESLHLERADNVSKFFPSIFAYWSCGNLHSESPETGRRMDNNSRWVARARHKVPFRFVEPSMRPAPAKRLLASRDGCATSRFELQAC